MNYLSKLEDLIGTKCLHNSSEDLSYWSDDNTIECIVNGFEYIIEDSFPSGQLTISISITPTDLSKFDVDDLEYMSGGVPIDSILFGGWDGLKI